VPELATQRSLVDEVHERALPVDLDHRKPLAVARFELGIAADVHLLELEAELAPKALDRFARTRAEMAAVGVVEDDLSRYG
jgi:hypothetical protein